MHVKNSCTDPGMTKEMADIENRFTYHAPKPELNQLDRYAGIRNNAKELALHIEHQCLKSRELSLALTKLEECVFWANAAIARNE